jgi:four helix bundle protein
MHDYHDLQVWNRAMDVAVRVYAITKGLAAANVPALRNQICRAVVSIPANIAEGARQESSAQNARFLAYAIGSTSEVESHLELAQRLVPGLHDVDGALAELVQIRRMLYALRSYHLRQAKSSRS